MLNSISTKAEQAILRMKPLKTLKKKSLVEFVSARMLQMMALCLNGETEQALCFIQ